MPRFPWRLSLTTSPNLGSKEASQERDLSLIRDHAGKLVESGGKSDDRLLELEERFEYFIEELGQENQYRVQLSEYVKDLREEAAFIKRARTVFGVIATLACIFLFVAPLLVCVKEYKWFTDLPEYPRAALLLGMLAAGVLLLQSLVKSVYRSASERQADEFIPPQLKLIYEFMGGHKG